MDAWISGPNANKIEVVIANNDGMAMGAVGIPEGPGQTAIPVFGVDALPEAQPCMVEWRCHGRYRAE